MSNDYPEWDNKAFGAMAYSALAVEGWDTEELLAVEADPEWVEAAREWAEAEGQPFPPVAQGRDFAGQIIAAAFGF
jgi:hypothetical protein